jgi:hypothetical protein
MTDLAKLVVRMEANTAKYQRELQVANKRALAWQRTTSKAVKTVSRAFFGLAGVAGAGALGGMVKRLIEADDRMAKLATRLGSTAGAFSEFEHVAALSGVTFETMTMGLQRMTRRIAEAAAGTGEAVGALQELGLEAASLKFLSIDRQFEVVADALAAVENEGDRVRLTMKLLDSEGVALGQAMKGGAAGIREMRAEARDLARTLTDEQAEAAERAADSFARLNAAGSAIFKKMVREWTPAVADMAEALKEIIDPSLRSAAFLRREIEKLATEAATVSQEMNATGNALERSFKAARLDKINKDIVKLELELANVETRARSLNGALEEIDVQELLEPGIEAAKAADKRMNALIKTVLKAQELEEIDLFPRGFAGLEETEAERIQARWDAFISKAIADSKEVDNAWQDLGLTFASAFEDAILEGEKLRGVMRGLLKDIARIIIRRRITEPLANSISSAFGGARAEGGPVRANTSYLVGERGPELFTPGVSGAIIPGAATVPGANITYNIDARGNNEAQIIATVVPLLERTIETTRAVIRKDKIEGRF